MNFPHLDKDCKFDKDTIIDMYNDMLEYLSWVEMALDCRDREISILKGEIEVFDLE